MALIKCPDCGKEFSEYAECCPECGCPVDAAKENHVEEKPQEKTIQSISEVSSPPQQHIEYNQVERPIEQKAQKNRVLYIVLGIVLLCAIGTGVNYFCCSEDLLINKEHAGEKLALATGLITPEMSETQKQERLSDTTFAHFLNNKAVTEITRQYIVLENPIGELLSQTEIEKSGMCESGELHTAKVIVKNNTNNEIPGTAYSVVFFSIEWLRNGIEGEYNKTSEIKTVQGITIAPHSNATVMIDDNSFLGGSSHVGMNYVAKLKMDISNPVFLEFYRPTGNEYNEYQADKEQVTTRNADNLFVYEGSWESPKFGSQPCRLSYTKNGETISNAQYTNLKYNATIQLKGDIVDGVLSFSGSIQKQPLTIFMFNDENHLIGIGQDECHEDFYVEIELYRINN